jgi:hypothetical protein
VTRRLSERIAGALDDAKTRVALRGATRVGSGTSVYGWPRLASEGELTIGRRAVFVSTPAPITLVVE